MRVKFKFAEKPGGYPPQGSPEFVKQNNGTRGMAKRKKKSCARATRIKEKAHVAWQNAKIFLHGRARTLACTKVKACVV